MSVPSEGEASGGLPRPVLLASAAALFAGGAYGIKVGVGADDEYKRKVAKDVADGKVAEVSGLVTHNETRLTKEGERQHVVSIIEYRDRNGVRHTLRSSRERFASEQVDVCFYIDDPSKGWVKADGPGTTARAAGILVASSLACVAAVACVVSWSVLSKN